MTQAAIKQPIDKGLSEHHTELDLSHGQWKIVNKLLMKSSDCYGKSLAPGISQVKVAQLRQRCREYCKNILHIYPQCADALALLSRIALDSNELGKAKKLIRQALEHAPAASVCWFSLGHIYLAEGDHKKARDCFQKTVKLEPSHFRAKAAYAYSCFHQGEIVSAFNIYKKLIHQNPEDPHVKSNLFACLKQLTADADTQELDDQLQFYLHLEDVDHSDLSRLIASLLVHRYHLDGQGDKPVDIAQLCKDTLYLQALKEVIFSSALIEDLNSSVRQHLLFARRCSLDELNLKVNLAIQAYNNEHVMAYDDSEQIIIDSRIQQSELILKQEKLDQQQQLTLLDNWVSLMMYQPSSCFSSLYNGSMLNHMIDTAAAINTGGDLLNNLGQLLKLCFSDVNSHTNIECLGAINDSVSRRVKIQYEENPYPRWLALPYQTPTEYQTALDTALPEHGFTAEPGQTLQVLVAGCGTGKHALQCARYFRNTQVTAIDISHASLAYAKNKAQQYQLNNIEFLQADILELQNIGKQFDIIECSGVLHHMNDPLEGAQVLKQLLKPGGLMKIGLYSERARKEVIRCRNLISEQKLSSRPKDMRELRRQILSTPKKWPAVLASPDFYSLSGCRDLLFHEQEHRFTPLQIESFCDDLGMDFLGFVRVPAKHYASFRRTYPLDKLMRNLDYWEAFEQRNPETFGAMYQFYVAN